MSVVDHGLEVLRKSVEDISSSFGLNPKAEYQLRCKIMNVVTGQFTFSGLSLALKNTVVEITDVATPIPAVPLGQRNAFTIQNKSTNIVYIGNSDVTADTVVGTTSGFELPPGGNWGMDITDQITLYARCETGKTALVKITEVA